MTKKPRLSSDYAGHWTPEDVTLIYEWVRDNRKEFPEWNELYINGANMIHLRVEACSIWKASNA